MDKSNLELFKQALAEGVSNKFDSIANCCTDEIVCSERHALTMRTIIYGKVESRRYLSLNMRRIIAILVAAALLLTGCGIIFRNEIREIIREGFIKLTYSEQSNTGTVIEEIYEFTYVPEGYYLIDTHTLSTMIKYDYMSDNGSTIEIGQWRIDSSVFIDGENGYTEIMKINDMSIYYRPTKELFNYLWTCDQYFIEIVSTSEISSNDLRQIINGMVKIND